MQGDVLDEAVAPPAKLPAHEAKVVRLDGVADRFGLEAHPDAGLVEGPCEIHVLGQRPARPSAVAASIAITSSVRTGGKAKVCAPALDPVLRGGRITVMPARRPTSPVPSVDPSSTRMIWLGGTVCASRLRIVSPTNPASL